jgi:predicted metal-dependent HD superfamily phosphohydrolase
MTGIVGPVGVVTQAVRLKAVAAATTAIVTLRMATPFHQKHRDDTRTAAFQAVDLPQGQIPTSHLNAT